MRNLVREQYKLTKDLLLEHKDKIQELGDRLLERETLNLPSIIEVLGRRPYGMNETMTEYLEELTQRQEKEEAEAAETEL